MAQAGMRRLLGSCSYTNLRQEVHFLLFANQTWAAEPEPPPLVAPASPPALVAPRSLCCAPRGLAREVAPWQEAGRAGLGPGSCALGLCEQVALVRVSGM
jgi:hypothetical protein